MPKIDEFYPSRASRREPLGRTIIFLKRMERSETITLGTLGILDHFSSLIVISTFYRFKTLPSALVRQADWAGL